MRGKRGAEGAVGRALLGPHRRWGGAVSAVNSQPEGREFPQAEFTSAEEYKSIGVPGLPSGKLGIGFAVVNVSDDGKVANMGLIVHIL